MPEEKRMVPKSITLNQGDIDRFWEAAEKVDADSLNAYLKLAGHYYADHVLNEPSLTKQLVNQVSSLNAQVEEMKTAIAVLSNNVDRGQSSNDTQPIGPVGGSQ